MNDVGSGARAGYTVNAPVRRGSDDDVWLWVLEHVIIPAGKEYRPTRSSHPKSRSSLRNVT